MTIQLDIHSFVKEIKVILSDREGQNLQPCFPTKSAVKKKKVARQPSIEKNPFRF
jgi:hypothetical protein